MIRNISRRSFVKGTAGAAAVGAASSRFFAPSLISAQDSTELLLWTAFGSGPNGEAQTKFVEDFNALDNGITVTSTAFSNYEELANAVLAGLDSGDVPHVGTVSDVWWFTLYLHQALADLTPYVQDADDYVQNLFVEYQRNGGQWGIPFARSTPIFYYNSDAFETAGIDPAALATWSSFAEVAGDLVDKGGVDYSFGFGNAASYGAWTMHGPVWAFGGRYSDPEFNIMVNQPEAVAAGEFMRSMINDHKAGAIADPVNDFIAGTLGTIIGSTGSLGNITRNSTVNFKTAFLPEEVQFGCPTGGAGLSILKNESDELKAAAAEFINFCTNTERSAEWAMLTGYMPVRTSGGESEAYQAFLADHPNNKVALEQLPKTQPQDSARVFIPNGDANLGRAWEQILVNNVEAQVSFDEVAALLDDDKKPVLEALEVIEG